MSEMYECIIVTGPRDEARQAFRNTQSPLCIGFGEIDHDLFAVYVKETGRLFNHAEDEKIAITLSQRLGTALLVLYDNRCGSRFAALYARGIHVREFGESDELWVALDEEGEPLVSGRRFRWGDIKDDHDGEYDCIRNAIDAGLEALGILDRLDSVILKQKLVYEFDY